MDLVTGDKCPPRKSDTTYLPKSLNHIVKIMI